MAVGCIRAIIYVSQTQTLKSWFTADTTLRIAAAAFFVWVGSRAIRRYGQEVPPTKVGWGRLLLGVVLIYIQVRDHFAPNPKALQPENAGEALGMQVMSAIFLIVGVALIFWAFLKKKLKTQMPAESAASADYRNRLT